MKKVLFYTLFLFICSNINAQNIEGTWQLNDSITGSMLDQNYQFLSGNKFEYHPSAYDGLSVIYTIGGTYQIKSNIIFFTVEYVEECLGGKIERSPFTTLNDSWSIINNCEIKKRIFKKKETYNASFKISNIKDDMWIEIDGRIYYLISKF